jgi:histidinol-phosphate aminotransferase
MIEILSAKQKRDLLQRGFSRRTFGRLTGLLAAGAALPFYNERALAQSSLSYIGEIPEDAVKINSNENPMGPCPEAVEAIDRAARKGGRYQYEETFRFVNALAQQEGLKSSYVMPFAGSSDPLLRIVLAYTSPTKSFVSADPGYEAGVRAADFIGAKTFQVPLTKTYAHDVKAMAAADPNAGLFYICNPNNPTGTATPQSDIEWLIENKPKDSIILLDEAYLHFSDEERCSHLVAVDKDLIILRTFSKLYGMAGLRAGAAFGRPDLLAKIQGYGAGALPVTGMVGAMASLRVKTLVPERKKNMLAVREDVFAFLHKNNIDFVPSESNCFMLNTGRAAWKYVQAMRAEKVYVGRIWPVWPTYCRVTIGTAAEMAKFKDATLKVLALKCG